MHNDPDAEFEVSDLRSDQVIDTPDATAHPNRIAIATGALARHATPTRRRVFGSALAIIGVALALALALREYSAATQGATTDANVDAQSPAASALYFEDAAPWGVLRVDGRVVDVGKLMGEQSPLFLHLGATRLDYSAPPYAALHCVISDPPVRSDTCPLVTNYAPQDPMQESTEGRLIDLRANLNRLSAAQFATLEQATEAALATLATRAIAEFSPSVQLAPGDHYVNAQGQVSVATQPLRAMLQLTFDRAALVNTNPTSGPPCRVFCVYSADGAIQAPITPTWVYTPVGANSPTLQGPFVQPNNANVPNDGDGFLQIDVNWKNGWRVSVAPYYLLDMGQGLCNSGILALGSSIDETDLGGAQILGVGDAKGCAFTILPQNTPATDGAPTVTGAPGALFFFRCGVLLSVNVAAQRLTPSLLVASPAEAQAAQAIAGPSFSSGR